MLLTLLYLYQHWKLRSITLKLLSHLDDSIVFYTFAEEGNVLSLVPFSSELCTNQSAAQIRDIILFTNCQRGVTVYPKQNIHLAAWITFPSTSHVIPFPFTSDESRCGDIPFNIYLLIETDVIPSVMGGNRMTMIEQFGKLIAWKVDTRISILLHSNENQFANLVVNTFLKNCFLINSKLPLIRIQSVTTSGSPQPFDAVKTVLPKDSYQAPRSTVPDIHWEKHINDLKKLSIFASQAAEYEYNKNRTEGKTGIAKPDLIQSTRKSELETHLSPNNSPNVSDLVKTVTSPRTTPRTSPLKAIAEVIPEEQSPIHTAICAKDQTSDPVPPTIETDKVRPKLVRSKGSMLKYAKPPNILVYSDSTVSRDCVIATLKEIVKENSYTIYALTPHQAKSKHWIDNTTLLVVCGYVSQDIGDSFTQYFLNGGYMMSVCSDLLHTILPTFRSHAEVREHELVQFSYGRWQKVKMMHHIFCYQPSPIKKHFSTDSEDHLSDQKPNSSAKVCSKRSVELCDQQKVIHNLQVQILGTEETWNTPSLLLATDPINSGVAIFSQVHLEANPNSYEQDEAKYGVLMQYEQARIEILTDLLTTHLKIKVQELPKKAKIQSEAYANGYFLGDHKVKYLLLDGLRTKMTEPNVIQTSKLKLTFCPRGTEPPKATAQLLPILVDACPEKFSTVDYFMTLSTEKIGRLALYSPVMTSSMDVLSNTIFDHGLVVIPLRQTAGKGRNDNQWLSPEGCGLFSMQLHIGLETHLGRTVSMIQHLLATAIVNAILSQDGYENLDLGIKWPNDIYAKNTKIGGIIVNSHMNANAIICNIGVGINLSNSTPTICINDLINEYNLKNGSSLSNLSLEKALALIFNEIERLIDTVQSGNLQQFLDLYYQHWLHSSAKVTVIDAKGSSKTATVVGIDEFGFLVVETTKGILTVHPDGNSFDMLQGLIIPK
ncbi:biotin--protein ligase [Bradysia coprophila]|uniref:biotin--protein ligase n=1 Tax=Bradysia coprophila TaxID=38358 RepID=UPI00187D89A8|nr:biotin--protein ligase [Bradysia coprophila]